MSISPALQPLLDKLQLWLPLAPVDQAALLALPHTLRKLGPHDYIVREDERPSHCCLLLSGYAYRHKVAGNGGRQIFSLHMKGDLLDLHNALLRQSDHNVEALTPVEVALIPVQAIRAIAVDFPQIGRAMWYDTLVDAAILREWMLNVGRRDARARTAHLLCEVALRMEVAGLGRASGYELPMTQDQLADALALTNVHISRMLKLLSETGLIDRNKRCVRILDFDRLARIGDFDDRYLHLDPATRDAP